MTRTTRSGTDDRWTWASVERGLWAAQIDHEFAGLVEQEIGKGYSPTNGSGRHLGTFATLAHAKSVLEASHPHVRDAWI